MLILVAAAANAESRPKNLGLFFVLGWQSTGDTDADHAGDNLLDFQQQSSHHHQLPINRRRQSCP